LIETKRPDSGARLTRKKTKSRERWQVKPDDGTTILEWAIKESDA